MGLWTGDVVLKLKQGGCDVGHTGPRPEPHPLTMYENDLLATAVHVQVLKKDRDM